MRFDEIDLVGDFKISGSTGPSGKVLGMTNGTVNWITVSSGGGGGGRGAQGPTGPSPLQFTHVSCAISIGNQSSLCSKDYLSFAKNRKEVNIFSSGGTTDLNNQLVGFISSYNVGVGTSVRSSIISSCDNAQINGSQNSVILSSKAITICGSSNSVIASSYNSNYCGIKYSPNSVILSSGGSSNYSMIENSANSSLISSKDSYISVSSGYNNNVILSSQKNDIYDHSCNSVIISSSALNSNFRNSKDSVLIGTCRGGVCGSTSSSVIGGCRNSVEDSTRSVILGGDNISLINKSDIAFVPNIIVDKIKFLPSPTTVPPNVQDGQIWYRNNQLYVRFGGSTGTFSLIT